MASTLNSNRPIGSFGSCSDPPMFELHFGGSELFDNVAGVGKGADQAVELGDHEGVTGATGG
jgi:hypothetical protein